MEYTVKKLAELAGVSSRTLRYYDEIGLLKPERINSSGYRIYGQNQVNQLQLILFYRELEVDLETILRIMTDRSFEEEAALKQHRQLLVTKQARLSQLINTIDQTLDSIVGGKKMSNEEKFQAFKEKKIEQNETFYGDEIRQKYGSEALDIVNSKVRGMSQTDYETMQQLEQQLFNLLKEGVEKSDSSNQIASDIARTHKQWLLHTWQSYSAEAHKGLAALYLSDPRFTTYYDKVIPGATQLLHDSIQNHAK
ncbi:transcriptional activator TipA [Bacillus sp. JCM 19045]|nr:transcriptional activator TipA [Bacillus sp. JCM 19045]